MFQRNVKMAILLALLLTAAVGIIVYLDSAPIDPDRQAAEEALAHREFRQAAEHLNKYLLTHPNDTEAVLLAAQTARRQDKFASAAIYLKKYRELNGAQDRLDLEFRLTGMQQGHYTEASGLMESFANRPQAPETPLVMEAVIIGILSSLPPTPSPNMTFTDKAVSLMSQARRAVDLWLELRAGQADRVAGLFWRGRIRALAGEQAEAITDLRQALELDPDHLEARSHLAFLVVQANPAEAASHFAIVRARNAASKEVEFKLATVYRTLGRLDEAIKILDEMLVDNPKDASPLIERGLIAMDRLQLDEAGKFLHRAFEVGPDLPEVNLALSQYMQLRHEPTKAKEYRDRFDRFEAMKERQ
ncbi:MAG TPA: tetratricopeptide repeat protein [Gemmata sp.]|jgi:tetratricopeptide (TPR) repeat protein|nr:tetratricopeptide repeat protein [Gemmata sp.]